MAKNHRGRNEGSIFQRPNKKWRAQIYHQGQRISKNTETKAEALEWIRTMQSELDKGYDFKGSTTTLKDYLPGWLENRRLSLRPKTAHQYAAIINNHILPEMGDKKLKDLRLIQIEQFYSGLLQKGLGPRTIRVIHNILHSSLDKAVRYGLVIFNPTHGATLPRYSHEEMTVLDSYQVGQFLVAAQNSPNYAFFHLAITTGMRMGELFGLKWSDIQWNAGVVHVQRQKQYVPGQGCTFTEPKTNAGRRTIKLGEGSLTPRSQTTFSEQTPELMDETATGDWLEFLCGQGLAYLRAHVEYLSEAAFTVVRVEEEVRGRPRLTLVRVRPGKTG